MTDMIEDQALKFSSDEDKGKGGKKTKGGKKVTARSRKGRKKTTGKTGMTHASTFKDFQLKEELLRSLGEAGFENPSDVQCEGIPYIIFGEDLLCQAKSGMGKTAVFVLGVLHSMEIPGKPFQCIVLANTRELAFQISKEFERLGKFIEGLKIATIYGGVNEEAQILQLENNPPHVVIGTPGRTLSLVKKEKIVLNKLKFFILDECDKILEKYDMRNEVQKIFIKTNHKKQVLMFTATLNDKIKQIAKKFMKEVS